MIKDPCSFQNNNIEILGGKIQLLSLVGLLLTTEYCPLEGGICPLWIEHWIENQEK